MTYLENCLLSLEKQTYQDFNVILVDNGSTDGSKELVLERFPNVTLLDLKVNTGFCKAVNEGIKASHSPYVILLNNDTTADREFVGELVRSITHNKQLFSVGAKMLKMNEPNKIDDAGDYYCALGWAFAVGKGSNACKFTEEKAVFAACGGAAIYRVSILEEIGLFDENHFAYLEDIDIGYRAKIFGYQNFFTPKAQVYHAGSGFSGSRYNKFKISLSSKNSIYLIYKNMPLLQIILNVPFLFIGFLTKMIFFLLKGHFITYVSGLCKGITFCFTKEARAHKVHFSVNKIGNYGKIQLELWANIIHCIRG